MASVLGRLTFIIQAPYSPAQKAKAQGRPVVAGRRAYPNQVKNLENG